MESSQFALNGDMRDADYVCIANHQTWHETIKGRKFESPCGGCTLVVINAIPGRFMPAVKHNFAMKAILGEPRSTLEDAKGLALKIAVTVGVLAERVGSSLEEQILFYGEDLVGMN